VALEYKNNLASVTSDLVEQMAKANTVNTIQDWRLMQDEAYIKNFNIDLSNATVAATPSTLMKRDANGDTRVRKIFGEMAILSSKFEMASVAPIIQLTETDQATNEKVWWIVPDGKNLQFRTVTDGLGTGTTAISINRGTGTAVSNVSFSVPIYSTVAIGTSPFNITSTTRVTNLNVDLLDGLHVTNISAQHDGIKSSIVAIDAGGAMEIGKYIDFHDTSNSTFYDFDVRFTVSSGGAQGLGTLTMNGAMFEANILRSTVANGTAPFMVTSATRVPNLNADMLDGFHVTAGGTVEGIRGSIPFIATDSVMEIGTCLDFHDTGSSTIYDYDARLTVTTGGAIGAGILTLSANQFKTKQFWSTVATGTAPLIINSTTMVTNLNANMVGGYGANVESSVWTVPVRDAAGGVKANIFYSDIGTSANGVAHLQLRNNTSIRWGIVMKGVESTGNAGSDFFITSYSDSGAYIATALSIARATGDVVFSGQITTNKVTLQNYNGIQASVFGGTKSNEFNICGPSGDGDNILTFTRYGNSTYTISANIFRSLVPTGTAPFSVSSSTVVNALNADMVDGRHASEFALLASPIFTGTPTVPTAPTGVYGKQIVNTEYMNNNAPKRINLRGLVQTTSYRKSVIALCNLTNTDTSAESYTSGTIFLKRNNGLYGATTINVTADKIYNTSNMQINYMATGRVNGVIIKPCTFTYNSVKYGGLEIYLSAAESNIVDFAGFSNMQIFGVDFYNTQTSTAINTEINNSLAYTDFTYLDDIYMNGVKILKQTDVGSVRISASEPSNPPTGMIWIDVVN
jgi:hypothetical protein